MEIGIPKDVRLFGWDRHHRIKKNRLMSRRRSPPAGIRIVGSGQSRPTIANFGFRIIGHLKEI